MQVSSQFRSPPGVNGSALGCSKVGPGRGVSPSPSPSPLFEGVFTPLRCLYVDEVAGGWSGEWFLDWQADGALDAPCHLPSGGHEAFEVNGRRVLADGYVSREWLL